ncbi:MlaD family protein [Conexibacter woesei]|uniref:MlaD family protein n=1 Tax=Conexibacter woesei TaxID=191495 RepID=UPI000418A58A|nr:MlaD family protein [Conexibacter woesei]
MRTESLRPARLVVVVGFALACFGLMLWLWNAFGGAVPFKPEGYRVVVALPEADGLAVQADVRISGVAVGHVIAVRPAAGDRKDAVLELDARYAPLRGDVRAMIRRKSLAGEEFLELTPGTARAAAVRDGGRLASANVAPSVEIDEVLRTFDPATRRALSDWIQTQATALGGTGGSDLNAALGRLPGFAEALTPVLARLADQRDEVSALVANTGVVFDAVSARRDALQGAIVNGERATGALARGADGLAGTFRALPAFEAESRRLLARVSRFQRRADPVLTALRPGARALSAAAPAVRAAAPELRALAHALPGAEDAARAGLPATRRLLVQARPFVAQFQPFLDQLQPVLAYIELRAWTLTSLVANLTAATNATTAGYGTDGAPVHYARAGMALNPASLAQYETRQSWSRLNPYPEAAGTVFDDGSSACEETLAFPKLDTSRAAGGFSINMLQQIMHFVLNDGHAAAPPCVLQSRPTASFPHVAPLSHPGGGATP